MDTGWTDEQEDLLRQWITQAYYEHTMHNHASVHYTKIYHVGGLITVCLASTTSMGVFFEFSTSYNNTVWGFVVLALLSFLTAVSAAIMQFLNPLSMANEHTKAQNLYNAFIVDAQAVLACRRCRRQPCPEYMAAARVQLRLLPQSCPVIPGNISKLYIRKVQRKKQELGELDSIVVAADDNGDSVFHIDQTDIEKELQRESQKPTNTALHQFLAEKSHILES